MKTYTTSSAVLLPHIAYELTPGSGVYRLIDHNIAVICIETNTALVIERPEPYKIKEKNGRNQHNHV